RPAHPTESVDAQYQGQIGPLVVRDISRWWPGPETTRQGRRAFRPLRWSRLPVTLVNGGRPGGEQPMTGEDANVVVGVDGSTSALRATAWAAQTAVRWHRPLLLTSVLDPPTPYGTGIGLRADRFVELETEGREWLDRARAVAERTTVDHHHTEVGTELVVGEVSSVLRERARDAFRVVVGGDRPVGETGTSASTAMALLPHAACPVAVVRWSGEDAEPPQHGPVVVGVDGSSASAEAM